MNIKRKITQVTCILLAASMINADALRTDMVSRIAVSAEEGTSAKDENILTIDGNIALNEDTSADGLIVKGGSFNLNGYTLTVNGDVYVNGGKLRINGGNLNITGNLIITNNVEVNGGKISVGGDLRIQSEKVNSEGEKEYYYTYGGHLIMTNEDDHVCVNGGFYTSYTYGTDNEYTNGTLEVKGDFTEYVTEHQNNFAASGNHKVILSGDKQQNVIINGITSKFANIEIKNKSKEGVNFLTAVNYTSLETNGNVFTLPEGQRFGWKLEKDETLSSDLILAGGVLDLNGHTLTVNGDLEQHSGTVTLNGGQLTVNGDYRIANGEKGASSGKLNMTNEKDVLSVKGNFETRSVYSHSSLLTSGKMEIGGDLRQYGNSDTNFRTSGSLEIILNGDKQQTIAFERAYGNQSSANILKIENTSEEGIVIGSDVYVMKTLYDTDTKLSGSTRLILQSGAVIEGSVWSHSLTLKENIKLEEDTVIKGDLYVRSTLDLNGKKLEVSGNVIDNGTIKVNGGHLSVGNDFRIQGESIKDDGTKSYGYTYSGRLIMNNEDDHVLVNGGFYTSYTYGTDGDYTNGTLEVKGDFAEYVTDYQNNFAASGNHKVILSGDKQQNVTIRGLTSKFANIEIKNESKEGVNFLTSVSYASLETNGNVMTLPEGQKLGWKLEKDEELESLILIGDELDLNGHTLTVKGDIEHRGGTIKINGGKLEVCGNYRIASGENGASSGKLNMTNEKDVLLVKGNFETRSVYSHSSLLTSGKMEIGGDLRQYGNSDTNFRTSGSLEIILNGDKQQTIAFERSSGNQSSANILKIENTSEEGVVIGSDVYIMKTLYDTDTKLSGSTRLILQSGAVIEGSVWSHSLMLRENIKLEEDTVIKGDLYVRSTLDLNGKKLEVSGNVIDNGTIKVNGGHLSVGNDFRIQGESIKDDGTKSYGYTYSGRLIMNNEDDHVLVNGGFYTSYTYGTDGDYTNGTLEVKGDFAEYVTDYQNNFAASGEHKVILSGDKQQNVTIRGLTSKFANIEIKNESKEGVNFLTSVNYASLETNGNVMTLPEGQKLGWKLEKDEELESLILIGDELDLNGHTLTVKGDIEHRGGTIKINGGKLEVCGNYRIASGENGASSGKLNMTNEKDVLSVKGNFETRSVYSHSKLLTAGKMEIGGDLRQYGNSDTNFRTSGSLEIILNGDKQQTIAFERSSGNQSSANILRIENTSEEGVIIGSEVYVMKALYDTDTKVTGSRKITLKGGAVLADSIWSNSLTLREDIKLEEDTVIKGDLYVYSALDLNGKKLEVGGNLIDNGTIKVNGGYLSVGKNFRIQSENVDLDGTVKYSSTYNGHLIMNNEDDYVCVNGGFYTSYVYGTDNDYTNGTLEVKGDFAAYSYDSYNNFAASGGHKVILSGNNIQNVTLTGRSGFNILEITQDIGNYKFSREEDLWKELIQTTADTKAPTVPADLKASEKDAVMIKISWSPSEDDNGVKGYDVYRNGVRLCSVEETEYTDTDIIPDTEYVYSVSAFDAVRNSSAKCKELTVRSPKDTTPPTVPSSIKLVSQTADSAKISWPFSTDNYKLESYRVYRNGKLVGETPDIIFEEKNVENGMHKYTVTSVDVYGNESEHSTALTVDMLPPEIPSQINVKYTDNTIVLSWKENKEEDLSQYTVYRKSSKDKDFVKLGNTVKAEYEDKDIKLGETYTYRITSSDTTKNESGYSEDTKASFSEDKVSPVISSVKPSKDAVIGNSTVVSVAFSDNFDMSGIKAEYSLSGADEWSTFYEADLKPNDKKHDFTPDVSSLKDGKYDMRISVLDTSGNISEYFTVNFEYHICKISKPELNVSGNGDTVQLSWDKTDEESFGSYDIYRKRAGEEKFAKIKNLTQNAYTDTDVEQGAMYTYYVLANDIYGNSVSSDLTDVSVTGEIDFSEIPYAYVINDGSVIITAVDKKAESIVIPEEIEGVLVSAIGDTAFKDSAVKKAVLPEGILSVGYSAFENCTALESVNIPSSVASIKEKAFYNCTSLKGLSVGNAVLSERACGIICGENGNDSADSSFILKASAGSSGQRYAQSNGIFFVPEDCMYIRGENGVKIIRYSGNAEDLEIPEKIENMPVTEISAAAFKGNTSLKAVSVPQTVSSIGSYAFMNCTSLSTIKFPVGTLSSIGADIIYNTPYESGMSGDYKIIAGNILYRYTGNNVNVIVPDSVKIIGCDAFADCDFIENVTIGKNVETIMSGAFFGCENIKEITVPETVSYIGDHAFSCCYALEKADISSKTSVGKDIFFECPLMKN